MPGLALRAGVPNRSRRIGPLRFIRAISVGSVLPANDVVAGCVRGQARSNRFMVP